MLLAGAAVVRSEKFDTLHGYASRYIYFFNRWRTWDPYPPTHQQKAIYV